MQLLALTRRFARLCTLLLTLSPIASVHAQIQDQGPNEILDAATSALAEISGFSANLTMRGEAGKLFQDALPSMTGEIFFGSHTDLGRVIHAVGESKEQQTASPADFDMLISSDRYLWTDTTAKVINERSNTDSSRGALSALSFTLIQAITQNEPFAKDANSAQAIDILEQQTIAGTLCDVIHIKRGEVTSSQRRSQSDSHTDVRWYIGTQDKLPRRVDHITDAGLVKITLIYELANLQIIEPTQGMLDINRPADFPLRSRMPKETPDEPAEPAYQPPNQQISQPSTQSTPIVPASPRITNAPIYEMTTQAGAKISNTTQIDRITVLYFWGSWCIPCNEASPLVSELAQTFEGQPVDIFGLAIREADLDQTASDFLLTKYQHQLVPEGDALVSKFKVRVFPTIAVIDQAGVIVYQRSIDKVLTTTDLINATTAAIQTALDAG